MSNFKIGLAVLTILALIFINQIEIGVYRFQLWMVRYKAQAFITCLATATDRPANIACSSEVINMIWWMNGALIVGHHLQDRGVLLPADEIPV